VNPLTAIHLLCLHYHSSPRLRKTSLGLKIRFSASPSGTGWVLSQNPDFSGAILSGAALGIFGELWLDSGRDRECSLALVSDRASTQEHSAFGTRDSRGKPKIRSTVPLRSAPEKSGFWLSSLPGIFSGLPTQQHAAGSVSQQGIPKSKTNCLPRLTDYGDVKWSVFQNISAYMWNI
jgi:hypothetical protein